MDIYKQIEESEDLKYLNELDGYVDMDFETLDNKSDLMKEISAKMFNLSVDEYISKQQKGFYKLKQAIKKRCQFLYKKKFKDQIEIIDKIFGNRRFEENNFVITITETETGDTVDYDPNTFLLFDCSYVSIEDCSTVKNGGIWSQYDMEELTLEKVLFEHSPESFWNGADEDLERNNLLYSIIKEALK